MSTPQGEKKGPESETSELVNLLKQLVENSNSKKSDNTRCGKTSFVRQLSEQEDDQGDRTYRGRGRGGRGGRGAGRGLGRGRGQGGQSRGQNRGRGSNQTS